jgi:hypothetical protein
MQEAIVEGDFGHAAHYRLRVAQMSMDRLQLAVAYIALGCSASVFVKQRKQRVHTHVRQLSQPQNTYVLLEVRLNELSEEFE